MLILLSVAITPTSAVTYTSVGVAPGSSSVYSQVFSVSTTENKMVISIITVSGTVVDENITYYLADGTLVFKINPIVDVNSNNYVSMESIIASGLTSGEPVYPAAPYIINDSSTMTVAGASRTVEHFKQGSFNASNLWLEDWWDQATGITVKWNLWFPVSYGGPYWQNVTMVSTTAWSPSAPAQSTFSTTSEITIAVVGIVALIVGFVAGRHGKSKR